MRKVSTLEKSFDQTLQIARMALLAFSTLVVLQNPTAKEVRQSVKSDTFEISFAHFSPAFAAFEDEFLFSEMENAPTLVAGKSSTSFEKLALEPKVISIAKKPEAKPQTKNQGLFASFDGESTIFSKAKSFFKRKTATKKTQAKGIETEELSHGSLIAMINSPQPAVRSVPQRRPGQRTPQRKKTKKDSGKVDQLDDNDKDKKKDITKFRVGGSIQLHDGLALLGGMEVSWVVNDTEMKRGTIDERDWTYQVEVTDPQGLIILSLYDLDDQLIGEGVVAVNELNINSEKIKQDIDVYPFSLDQAGMVYDAVSIGSGVYKPVSGAEVALYSFNEATQTNHRGHFSFPEWKGSQSKTLAIASREGYRDSIFMLDSKIESKVLLLTKRYVSNLFGYIENKGQTVEKEQGLIYGQIVGQDDRSGFKVHLEKEKAIYFEYGLAEPSLRSSSSSGLFTFVNLQDGDYELLLEKDGEIIDRRVVVVEQGKISPVIIDLRQSIKTLEFYDPLSPDRQVKEMEISFFDGTETLSVANNRVTTQLPQGHDSALLEYGSPAGVLRNLTSRDQDVSMLPHIENNLLQLAQDNAMDVSRGLIIGFVESDFPYSVERVEGNPKKLIYFDASGEVVDPRQSPAFGFIMGDFDEGLSSLIFSEQDRGTVIASDLVFSNHQSISVLKKRLE